MKHIPEIDGLRAWMAWWVVCQHVLQISGIDKLYPHPLVKLMTMGGLAVIVFVVISGFVITNLIVVKPENYKAYIARRFMRIFPIYVVAICANLMLQTTYYETFSLVSWNLDGDGDRVLKEWEHMQAHLILHATMMHGVIPDAWLHGAGSAILRPAWSLSLEWQYYLIAPLAIANLFWKTWAHHLVTIITALTLSVLAYNHAPAQNWPLPAFLPLLIGFFMMGAISRMWFTDIPRTKLGLPLLLAALNFVFYARAYTGGHLWVAAIPVVVWLATLFAFGFQHTRKPLMLFSRFVHLFVGSEAIRNLGTWSYSTYLLHIPLFVVALWLLHQTGLPINQYNYFFTLLVASLLLVPISWLCYHHIEKPAMRAGNRWIGRKPAAIEGIA